MPLEIQRGRSKWFYGRLEVNGRTIHQNLGVLIQGTPPKSLLDDGVKIRGMCPHLNKYQRPLGNMILETLGFGSTIVTFRNCPNNAPLAFWAGDPWYPLFPRKTN